MEESGMSRTLFQRIATGLLPFVLVACATNGGAQNPPTREDGRARLAKAEAMFAERCKKSGEFIHRTAENVEGIFLMKIRPEGINYGDQFALTDPYGNDSEGDSYIKSFLKGYHPRSSRTVPGAPPRFGYRYIEALDPKDGKRYRYTGSVREVEVQLSGLSGGGKVRNTKFVLDRNPAYGDPPRYGVTYDDISTREEREYWIAGSSLKVIDLQTNELMAERIGYMMDRGQGERGGGRSPWLLAADHACPTFQRNPFHPIPPGHGASAQAIQTEDFVEKVLKPSLEN
jgi:hypothetical protein